MEGNYSSGAPQTHVWKTILGLHLLKTKLAEEQGSIEALQNIRDKYKTLRLQVLDTLKTVEQTRLW